jgi:dienelactone hydrolase
MRRATFLAAALLALLAPLAAGLADAEPAALTATTVAYKAGDADCEGLVAAPAGEGRKPAILVVHDWMGVSPFVKAKVEQLAQAGYVALGADVYGKGVRPTTPAEAGALAGKYKGDRPLFRARLAAALATLVARADVDPARVVAIGYCFGGTGALELARSGADLRGIVSFHGGLSSPTPEDAKHIKGKVLALHGAADPFVPPAEVAAFEKEMTDAKVDWKLVPYEGAVHAFTNPAAGNDPTKGAAYDEKADRASWLAATAFFAERFTVSATAPAADAAADAKAVEAVSKAYADARAAGDAAKLLELTKALLPTEAEVRQVIKTGPEADAFVTAYRPERIRGDANEAAKELLKPASPVQTVTAVHSATTEEIVADVNGSLAWQKFPGGVKDFARAIAAPGRIWHVVEYFEPGVGTGQKYSVFTVLAGKVLFLYKPWKGLRR